MRFFSLIRAFLFFLTLFFAQFSRCVDTDDQAQLGLAKMVVTGVQAKVSQFAGKRLSVIKEVAEKQWKPEHQKKYLRTRVNMVLTDKPEFIVFFAHGYRPKLCNYEYSKSRALAHVVPFLKTFRFVVFHPLLSVGPLFTTFAQDDDIFQVKFHLDKILALVNDPTSPYYKLPVICAGHSNGASTLLATFGTNPDLAGKVSSLLLFAPYADVRNTTFFKNVSQGSLGHNLTSVGPRLSGIAYNSKKKAPLDYVTGELFPRKFPFYLIHCLDDKYVPMASNYRVLVKAFQEHGYSENMHLHSFEAGGHGSFSIKSLADDRKKLRSDLERFINALILNKKDASSASEIFQEKSSRIPAQGDFLVTNDNVSKTCWGAA